MLPSMDEHRDALLSRRDVETRTGLSRASIYRLMRQGQFPEPYRVGRAAVRWPAAEIAQWVTTRPRATGRATVVP